MKNVTCICSSCIGNSGLKKGIPAPVIEEARVDSGSSVLIV